MTLDRRKGGPHSEEDKKKRIEEVHKLYFDYGFSEREIANQLRIHKATVSNELKSLNLKILKDWSYEDHKTLVLGHIERLEMQGKRLRQQLDEFESFREKVSIEKFLFNIQSKITEFQIRFCERRKFITDLEQEMVNIKLNEMQNGKRVLSKDVFYTVSKKAYQKIMKIYYEDKGLS